MDISLAPEILFRIGPLAVTNSLFLSFVLTVILLSLFLSVRAKAKLVPGRIQNIIEVLLEGGFNFINSVTGSVEKTKRIFPLVFTVFIFILASNLWTFIPGLSALTIKGEEGSTSVFRAVMSDYGQVFIMTMVTIVVSQIVAILAIGPFGYIGKFINLTGFIKFGRSFKDKNIKMSARFGILAQACLDFFLGFMDIIGELAKVVSLSFRLFGNIFAGEVLSAVMFFIGFSVISFGWLKAEALVAGGNILVTSIIYMPFMFLGLLTAIVQSFVFSVLTLIFIVMSSELGEEKAE